MLCSLADYKTTFPLWHPQKLGSLLKDMDSQGLDLISVRPSLILLCGEGLS